MEVLLCTNTGLPLPRRRAAPPTSTRSVPVSLGRRSLPTRGLRCVGADWPEPSSFVSVADETDAAAPVARKARAFAGTGGEEEKAWLPAINGVDGGELEESVSVPVTPFEKSLVVVDSVSDEALSKTLSSKASGRDLCFFSSSEAHRAHSTGKFAELNTNSTGVSLDEAGVASYLFSKMVRKNPARRLQIRNIENQNRWTSGRRLLISYMALVPFLPDGCYLLLSQQLIPSPCSQSY